jgi:thimet oligopeptidase
MSATTPHTVITETRSAITQARAQLTSLLGVKGPRGEANTLVPNHRIQLLLSNAGHRAGLLSEVHPEKAVREAAETAVQEVSAFATELSLHRGLYEALASVPAEGLAPDTHRHLEHTLRDFRRAGVDRDEPTRARLKELADKAVRLGQDFDRAIREDVRAVFLRPEQLAGLPPDYVAAHSPGPDGRVRITTDYPDLLPFRQYAQDGEARRQLYLENSSRAWPGNERVLREILEVRAEQARLLGAASWADYITEDKMSRSAQTVAEFLARVAGVSEGPAARDVERLLERKRRDFPASTRVEDWEKAFYEQRVKQEQFSFDSQAVRPYFEFSRVRDGLLDITSRLFGIRYAPVRDASAWHPKVKSYDVFQEGEKLGQIHLDLHPRPDKYKHAAQFPIVSGVAGIQLPEGALICNFPDPEVHSPALLDHDDVVTLFHEFGHLMHHVLGGHQRWLGFSGVATEWDFVEAPSQMLEEWAWDPTTLRLFARHLETDAPIPAELVERMRQANEFGKGAHTRHQVFYAELSLLLHSKDPAELDITRTMIELQARYSPFPYVEGTHFFASFGHLNGYSAMYYTYLWSLVIAKDLLGEFQRHGLLDVQTARRYRDAVLAPGGSRDAADLIKEFLGRPYGFEAFQAWLERG